PYARGRGARIVYLLSTPVRLSRQRTSVQLIASYVAVVLLVILLFEITVMASVFWQPETPLFGDGEGQVDPFLGERAAAYVQWLDPEHVADVMDDQPVSAERILALSGRLEVIANGEVPGFTGLSPYTAATDEVQVLITDPSGTVVAATPNSLRPRQSLEDLPDEPLRSIGTRNRLLAGAIDDEWHALRSGRLEVIANGEVPGFTGLSPYTAATDEVQVLITDPSGTVVAATPNSLRPRQSLEDLPDEPLRSIGTRNRLLAGAIDDEWNAL